MGWYVVNARDADWKVNDVFGAYTRFEQGGTRFEQVGINIGVLEPGQPACLYHGEADQEGFLVLSGTPVLLIEGEERQLKQWDYVHCPPDVAHAIVGAGEGLSLVLAVGNRLGPDVILYPRDETALKHGAGVEQDTPHPKEAYARFTRPAPDVEFREEFLAG